MTQEPHPQPFFPQRPHHVPVYEPRDPQAEEGAVNHLDAVERTATAFLEELRAVGGGRFDERGEGGEFVVGFLGGRAAGKCQFWLAR